MSAPIAVYGRLGQDQREVQTRNNKPMTVCSLACELGHSTQSNDD